MIPQKLAPVGTHLWLELVKKTEEITLPPFQVLESEPYAGDKDGMVIESSVPHTVTSGKALSFSELPQVLCLQNGTVPRMTPESKFA